VSVFLLDNKKSARGGYGYGRGGYGGSYDRSDRNPYKRSEDTRPGFQGKAARGRRF